MKSKSNALAGILLAFLLICPIAAYGAGPVQLPAPRTEGGKPLMQALKDRKTTRTFSDRKLDPQTLSNLLWAAFGINRPDGRRTAPSAKNRQEIEIYVAAPDGLFLWDAHKNILNPISDRDLRALTGVQSYVGEAALNLVYVANYSRAAEGAGAEQHILVGADTGVIAENVYLFCASEGMATVVRAGIDHDALAKELKLKPEQKIILAQSVGYPKK